MRNIASWLERHGLAQYCELFASEAIDLETLPSLTEQDLRDLGLPLGHRRKLLDGLAQLASEKGHVLGAYGDSLPEPERRQLTILFCDLINSTALSRRLDPEELCDLIGAYQQICAGPIEQYGGFIARYIGDGILAYFGYPRSHEDDAERAVRAGLGIVESITKRKLHAGSKEGEPLAVRVGISTGNVVVGYAVGKGAAEESGVAGEAANLAAKLQQLASPNTLVVSSATKDLTAERFEFRDGGERPITGYDKPVRYWYVAGEREVGCPERQITPTPLFGRENEIAQLLRQWDSAAAGCGSVTLVQGRAGIGKTRLIAAVREKIAQSAAMTDRPAPLVMTFSCSAYRSNTPLYPIINQIARLMAFDADDTNTIKIGKLVRFFEKSSHKASRDTIGLFAELLGIEIDEPHPGLATLDAREKLLRTLQALQGWFKALTRRQPLLLIFEDAQWIDHTSGLFLARLVDWVADASVSILISQRTDPGDVENAGNLTRLVAKWLGSAHFKLCELDRLNVADAKRLIASSAGSKTLSAALTEAILQKAEGVPLYLEELTRTLLDSAQLAQTPEVIPLVEQSIAIPSTLSGALMARLDGTGQGKLVAQHASVIGREFSLDILEQATTLPSDRLMEGVARLTRADIIQRIGPASKRLYAFKHALVQEAAYRSLLRRRRKEIHSRIALLFVQHKKHDFDLLDDVIAQHYARGGQLAEAITWWRRAAAGSFARSAHVEAANLLEHALDAIRSHSDIVDRQVLELNVTADLAAALRSTRGYAAQEVEEQYLRARGLSESTGDLSKRFNVEWGLMQCNLVKGNVNAADEIADSLFSYAADDRDRPLSDAHLAYGMVKLHLGDFAGARTALEKGAELSSAETDVQHYFTHGQNPGVFCRSYLAQALWFLGNADQAKTIIDENLSTARSRAMGGSQVYTYVNVLTFAARIYSYRRDPASVAKISEELIQASRKNHYAYYEAQGVTHLGWALAADKFAVSGIRQMREGLASLERTGTVLGLRGFRVQLAELHAAAGDHAAALTMLDASTDRMTEGSRMWDAEIERVRGLVLMMAPLADVQAAEAAFQTSLEIARRQCARALELRTAASYARLLHKDARTREACQLLNDSLGKMTEGTGTRDMLDAQSAVAELTIQCNVSGR
jgi:class 3 adenylate cyclase